MECFPQRNEGFIDAMYVHIDKAKTLVRYEDEKKIIKRGLEIF